MARTAENPVLVAFPAELPAGCEVIQAERKLKDGTEVIISRIVPKEGNAEGVKNWIKMVSESVKAAEYKDGDTVVENAGVRDASNAIRSAAFDIVPKLTAENYKDSKSLYLPVSGPRTVDPFEAATAKVTAAMREKGRMLSQEELNEIYSGLV
jgi:hypothetical protein